MRLSVTAGAGWLLLGLFLTLLAIFGLSGIGKSLFLVPSAFIVGFGSMRLAYLVMRLRPGTPAMTILPDGISVGGLVFEKAAFIPWKQMACAYEKQDHICILPANQTEFCKDRPWWIRWAYGKSVSKYGTMLAFSPNVVDIDWQEFSDLVRKNVPIGTVVAKGIAIPGPSTTTEKPEAVSKSDLLSAKTPKER